MIVGTIRPREVETFTVNGYTLEELQRLIADRTPAGWDVISTRVSMEKRDTLRSCEAIIARRDGATEIEAPSFAEILQLVPEGQELLAIRRVG